MFRAARVPGEDVPPPRRPRRQGKPKKPQSALEKGSLDFIGRGGAEGVANPLLDYKGQQHVFDEVGKFAAARSASRKKKTTPKRHKVTYTYHTPRYGKVKVKVQGAKAARRNPKLSAQERTRAAQKYRSLKAQKRTLRERALDAIGLGHYRRSQRYQTANQGKRAARDKLKALPKGHPERAQAKNAYREAKLEKKAAKRELLGKAVKTKSAGAGGTTNGIPYFLDEGYERDRDRVRDAKRSLRAAITADDRERAERVLREAKQAKRQRRDAMLAVHAGHKYRPYRDDPAYLAASRTKSDAHRHMMGAITVDHGTYRKAKRAYKEDKRNVRVVYAAAKTAGEHIYESRVTYKDGKRRAHQTYLGATGDNYAEFGSRRAAYKDAKRAKNRTKQVLINRVYSRNGGHSDYDSIYAGTKAAGANGGGGGYNTTPEYVRLKRRTRYSKRAVRYAKDNEARRLALQRYRAAKVEKRAYRDRATGRPIQSDQDYRLAKARKRRARDVMVAYYKDNPETYKRAKAIYRATKYRNYRRQDRLMYRHNRDLARRGFFIASAGAARSTDFARTYGEYRAAKREKKARKAAILGLRYAGQQPALVNVPLFGPEAGLNVPYLLNTSAAGAPAGQPQQQGKAPPPALVNLPLFGPGAGLNVPHLLNTSAASGAVGKLARAARERPLNPDNAEDRKLLKRAWKQLHGPGAEGVPPDYSPEEDRLAREALRPYLKSALFSKGPMGDPLGAPTYDGERLSGYATAGSPVGRLAKISQERDLNPADQTDRELLRRAWEQFRDAGQPGVSSDYTPEQVRLARNALTRYRAEALFSVDRYPYAGSAVTQLGQASRVRTLNPNDASDRELLQKAWRQLYEVDPNDVPPPYSSPDQIALAKRVLEPYTKRDLFQGKTLQDGPPGAYTYGSTDFTMATSGIKDLARVSEERELNVNDPEDRKLLRSAWKQANRHEERFGALIPRDYSREERAAADVAFRQYGAKKLFGGPAPPGPYDGDDVPEAPVFGAAGCGVSTPSYYDNEGIKHTHHTGDDLIYAGCGACRRGLAKKPNRDDEPKERRPTITY